MLFLSKSQISYFKTIPFSFQLLLIIIAIKPIFNTLEEIYLWGTPVTILRLLGFNIFILLISGIYHNRIKSSVSLPIVIYKIYFYIYLINILIVLFANFDFLTIRMFLKILTASITFFYFLQIIKNKSDLDLIISFTLIAAIPLMIISFYDIYFVGSYQMARDLMRLTTSFGDVASNGAMINIIYSIFLYQIITDKNWQNGKHYLLFCIFLILSILIFSKIQHAASSMIFVFISIVFVLVTILYSKNNRNRNLIIFFLVFGMSTFIFQDWIIEFYDKVFFKEYIELIDSQDSILDGRLFHNRTMRWRILLEHYYDQSIFKKMMGGTAISYPELIEHHPHNDFFRILFTTGLIGLLIYILFIISTIIKIFKKNLGSMFLGLSAMTILLMYSITLTPSTYVDLNLYLMPVFIYIIKFK